MRRAKEWCFIVVVAVISFLILLDYVPILMYLLYGFLTIETTLC